MAREKPTQIAERKLVEGMLDGTYPPGSALPGERDLCKALGVARPPLREALQRLAREGWLEIQQGRSTLVRDFMRLGNLNLLVRMLQVSDSLPSSFVPDLLEIWSILAPAYTRCAYANQPKAVGRVLAGFVMLDDEPAPYVKAQWDLHRALLNACDNPVYGLILNSFGEFYQRFAVRYYAHAEARAEARELWQVLYNAVLNSDVAGAEKAMQEFMASTRNQWWQRLAAPPGGEPPAPSSGPGADH